jgi:hypothetical protein
LIFYYAWTLYLYKSVLYGAQCKIALETMMCLMLKYSINGGGFVKLLLCVLRSNFWLLPTNFTKYKILSILFSLPLEPFNEHTWWRLFQKHFVHIKSDIRWVFYFINEILQQLSIVFGNDQNSYIFPMISQKDIFSINRLTMKLKISGSVTDI